MNFPTPGGRPLNILILYHYTDYPLRVTIQDHLYSFQRHSGHRCFYLNLANRSVPAYLKAIPFDLIVFHTVFLSLRWDRAAFERLAEKVRGLKTFPAVKIVLPQDEFIQTDIVCDFINDLGVGHVFSVAPPSEWPKIYHSVDFDRTRFHYVLTGYLEGETLARIEALSRTAPERTLDVGYRAWRAEPWLGRHGFLKTQIAELFQRVAPDRGLRVHISTDAKDTLKGDGWYEFLLRCRYTIGVEGGATILDRDGSIQKRTDAYVKDHPHASFDEVEAHCFPGQDGSLGLLAISPRHLEACATRTGQVLVEGEYNGVLEPGAHYIELKRDFGNLDEVLERMGREDLREAMVERAYRDVVASGRYTYGQFVREVLESALEGRPATAQGDGPLWERLRVALLFAWMRRADAWSWKRIGIGIIMRKRLRRALEAVFSPEKVAAWRRSRTPGAVKRAEG
jgi:hypothetical protein